MAFGMKHKEESYGVMDYVKAYSLPVYVVVSVVFIIYTLYSYAMGVVYNSGYTRGQADSEVILQQTYDQGYAQAVQQLMEQTSSRCEAVALTLWDQQVDVVNVACLMQNPAVDESMMEMETDITE